MAHFKGGRGKKVTYETQMYRIPTPMRPVVEKAGLQFRLLWDGLTDPTGEKLLSRINRAIADPEQLGDISNSNQISTIPPATVPDIKYQELERELKTSREAQEAIGRAWEVTREKLEATKAQVLALQDLTEELSTVKTGAAELRSQLQDAEELVVALRAEIEQLKSAQPLDLEAIAALPDSPSEDEKYFEEMKVPSDDDIVLTTDLEEVEEGHSSTPPSTRLTTATVSPSEEAISTIVAASPMQPALTQEKESKKRSAATDEQAPRPTTKERAEKYPFAPMNSVQLGKRLDIDQSVISRAKAKGNEHLRKWSAEHDPQGIEWEYRDDEKPHYHPVLPHDN